MTTPPERNDTGRPLSGTERSERDRAAKRSEAQTFARDFVREAKGWAAKLKIGRRP